MADKDDDLVVNVDDLDTVAVNVDDDVKLAQEPDHIKKEAKKEPRKRAPVDQQVVTDPSPDEALQQAQAYAKTQEDARRAAEATAANERSLREQAQREALQAQQTAEQFRERADNSELTIIENGINSAIRELEAQEAEYVRAAEAGEFAKMGSIQTKISKAAAALDRLETQKASYTPGATKTTEGRVEAQPVVNTSAMDRYLSQFAPAAQTWLRQHPDCAPAEVGGSSTKNSKMMAGHYAALAQNIQPNTTEYFKVIEDHIGDQQTTQVAQTGITSKAAEIQVAGEQPQPKPKHVATAAPVSRDPPNSNAPRNVREVRLTKEQQEMAKVSFPHLPEAQAYGQYARNLIELESEGKIGRLTH